MRGSATVPPAVAGALVGAAVVGACVLGVVRYRALRAEDARVLEPEASVRHPTFVDPSAVSHESRFAFAWDGPEPLRAFREAERLDEVVAGAATAEDRVRRLMTWTRAQFEVGYPSPYPPPDAASTLREIRAGRTGGFCAQYAFVLVQAAQSLGVPARVVTLEGHEVTEAWLDDERRWTMVDPMFSLQVTDGAGRSLSALEVHEAASRGDTLRFTAGARWTKDVASYLPYFSRVGVWTRNAFVTRPINYEDFRRYRVWFEEPPRQGASPSLRTTFREDLYSPPTFP